MEIVPGNTKEAKATVLMARDARLSYREAIRIAAAMMTTAPRRKMHPALNSRALNGYQPEESE